MNIPSARDGGRVVDGFVQENQGTLYEDVKDTFALARKETFAGTPYQFWEATEKKHGREEIRKQWLIQDEACLKYLNSEEKWKGLQAIGMVESQRRIGRKVTNETP